jgi:hypothetical protein
LMATTNIFSCYQIPGGGAMQRYWQDLWEKERKTRRNSDVCSSSLRWRNHDVYWDFRRFYETSVWKKLADVRVVSRRLVREFPTEWTYSGIHSTVGTIVLDSVLFLCTGAQGIDGSEKCEKISWRSHIDERQLAHHISQPFLAQWSQSNSLTNSTMCFWRGYNLGVAWNFELSGNFAKIVSLSQFCVEVWHFDTHSLNIERFFCHRGRNTLEFEHYVKIRWAEPVLNKVPWHGDA